MTEENPKLNILGPCGSNPYSWEGVLALGVGRWGSRTGGIVVISDLQVALARRFLGGFSSQKCLIALKAINGNQKTSALFKGEGSTQISCDVDVTALLWYFFSPIPEPWGCSQEESGAGMPHWARGQAQGWGPGLNPALPQMGHLASLRLIFLRTKMEVTIAAPLLADYE